MPYVCIKDRNDKEMYGTVSLEYQGNDLHIHIGKTYRIIPNWREKGMAYLAKVIGREEVKVPEPVKVPIFITSPYFVKFRNLAGEESIEPYDDLKLTEDEFVASVQGVVVAKLPIKNLISIERIKP